MRTNQTEIRARIILATASVLFLAGCGGTTAPQAAPPAAVPIVVNVVPTTAWVTVGRSEQFSATVLDDPTNKGVSWGVSGNGCAGAGCGTIGSNGMYTAPGAVPSQNTVKITATSLSDPTKSASATAHIITGPTGVTISPAAATVQAGATQQFSAAVSPPEADQTVIWSVVGAGCAGGACGSIDPTGRYTAPASIPVLPRL